MKLHSRWLGTLAVAAAVATGLAAPRAASAQDAVVAIKSAGELLNDLRFLVKAVAPEGQAEPVLQMLEGIAGPDQLQGLDRERPIAVMASMPAAEGEMPMIVGAVPVTDYNTLLNTLRGLGLPVAEAKTAPGFTHQITLPDGATTLFLTSANGYAYATPFATNAAQIKALKPADFLPRRPNLGDISATFRLDRLPEPMKQQFLDSMKQQMAAEQEREEDESDAEYQAKLAGMKLVEEAFTRLVQDASALSLDLTIDEETQQVSAELSLSAKPGSPMAEAVGGFANRKSRFRALGAGAPVAAWASLPMPKEFQEVMGDLLDEARKQAEAEADSPAEKQLVGTIMDAIKPTFTGDELDLGWAIQGPPSGAGAEGKYVFIAGIHVVEGKQLDQAFRQAIQQIKPEDRDEVEIALDFAKAADGTTIHKLVPKEGADEAFDEEFTEIFGKAPAVFMAVRDDVIYVTFGTEGQAAIENALTARPAVPAAGTVEAPVALVARTARIAGMMQENQEAAAKAAAEVFTGPNADKDRLVTSFGAEGGTLRLRFALDVPALTFFARVGEAISGGQGAIQINP